MDGEHYVSSLARLYPMSFAAVQKHVAVLARAGLVTKRATAASSSSAPISTPSAMPSALDQFEAMWRGRIDRFDDVLAEEPRRSQRHDRDQRAKNPTT